MMSSKIDQKIQQKEANDDSERAVSPVIGVILMVAITVILAAVIGVFVLEFGSSVSDSPPTVQFDMTVDSDNNAKILHEGGEVFEADSVSITNNESEYTFESGSVSAGDKSNSFNVSDGDTVRVVWESDNGEKSNILFERTYNE
jgi:flagellin-like protein